jgi:hypothetical protein
VGEGENETMFASGFDMFRSGRQVGRYVKRPSGSIVLYI